MSQLYEIVVYTASVSKYADPLLDILDPTNLIAYRLFREHCTTIGSSYVKDLSRLGRDLKEVIIVDNSSTAYALQPENAVPISTWVNDMTDTELEKLSGVLKNLAKMEDVREGIKKVVKEGKVEFRETLLTTWKGQNKDLKPINEEKTDFAKQKISERIRPVSRYATMIGLKRTKTAMGGEKLVSSLNCNRFANVESTPKAGLRAMKHNNISPAKPVKPKSLLKVCPLMQFCTIDLSETKAKGKIPIKENLKTPSSAFVDRLGGVKLAACTPVSRTISFPKQKPLVTTPMTKHNNTGKIVSTKAIIAHKKTNTRIMRDSTTKTPLKRIALNLVSMHSTFDDCLQKTFT